MNVLYIGGTGTISSACVEASVTAGHCVTVLNRGNRPLPAGVEQVIGDKEDEAVLRQLAGRGFDVVCQFLLYTPEQADRDIEIFAGQCGQYVFISSASVYAKPSRVTILTEDCPIGNPYWTYAQNKVLAEGGFGAAMSAGRLAATIVRPSHTFRDRFPGQLISGDDWAWRILNRRPIPIHGDGTSLWTWTHSSDFARPFVGLLGNPAALGETFHITRHLEAFTWNDMYQAMGKALGVEPVCVHIPTDVLVRTMPEQSGPLYGDKSNCALFDNSKVMRVAGPFTCRVGLQEGMDRLVKHYNTRTADGQAIDESLHAKLDTLCHAIEQL